MALEDWVSSQLPAERAIGTIQLAAEGTVWETWGAPFGDPEAFLNGVKAVITANAAESRKGRVGLLFTALGTDGQIKSQFATHCMGTNANADSLVGSGGGSAKAFSDAMTGQASLMNTLLKAAQNMVEYVTLANKSLTEQLVDLQNYKHAMQQLELAEKADSAGVSDFLVTQLKENSPLVMQALNLLLEGATKNSAAAAPKAVAAVTSINGAKS
jgi:hypothetical protein